MLYEAVFEQVYYQQQVINRLNYVMTGTPASVTGSFALAFALGTVYDDLIPGYPDDTYFAIVRTIQNANLTYNQIIVKAIYDVTDFWANPFPTGTAGVSSGGDDVSPVVSLALRSNRVRTDIGRGYKRFAGGVEAAFAPGGTVVTGTLEVMEELCTIMSEPITYNDSGNVLTFTPCIVGKESYVTPSGKTAYKYYDTLAEQEDHLAQGITWQPYDTMRTQRSRQYGRGS